MPKKTSKSKTGKKAAKKDFRAIGRANLANSREKSKQHLKTGGKEHDLTIPELEFCCWRAQGASIVDAARFAGVKTSAIYTLEHRPSIQAKIAELKKEFESDAIDRTKRMREDLATFVHGEYRHRMRTARTHSFHGDNAIAKMLETGFKASGFIEAAKTVNQANAGAAAGAHGGAQLFAKRLYLPDWRKETIEKLQHDERSTSRTEVPERTELPAR
jgi:hypothetical protein